MKSISVSTAISLISLSVLGTTTSFLLLSVNFESAFAQTEISMQNGNNSLGNNNTVTYSFNILSRNNTQETLRLQNSSVSYYDNTTGYLVYPELSNNTQQQQLLLPAVIMIHEWLGLNEHIKNQADILAKEGYVV